MKPQETHRDDGAVELHHPAFGIVNLSRYQGAKEKNLYGSDVKHMNTISLKISTARTTRQSNKTWMHPHNQIIEIEMSETQFGQMLCSFNQGAGTPVTLRWHKGEGFFPEIEAESLHETFNKEMKQSIRKNIEKLNQEVKALRQVINEGKLGKKI